MWVHEPVGGLHTGRGAARRSQTGTGCSLEKHLRYSPNHPSLCLYYSESCLGPIPGETLVQTQIRFLLYILAVGGSQLPRGTGLFPLSFHLEETQTHPELAMDTSLRLLGLRHLMFVPLPRSPHQSLATEAKLVQDSPEFNRAVLDQSSNQPHYGSWRIPELQEVCSFCRGLVNHIRTNRIFPSSPGSFTFTVDLILSVARDAHLQRKSAKFIVRGTEWLQNSCVLPLEIRSLSRRLKESAATRAHLLFMYLIISFHNCRCANKLASAPLVHVNTTWKSRCGR